MQVCRHTLLPSPAAATAACRSKLERQERQHMLSPTLLLQHAHMLSARLLTVNISPEQSASAAKPSSMCHLYWMPTCKLDPPYLQHRLQQHWQSSACKLLCLLSAHNNVPQPLRMPACTCARLSQAAAAQVQLPITAHREAALQTPAATTSTAFEAACLRDAELQAATARPAQFIGSQVQATVAVMQPSKRFVSPSRREMLVSRSTGILCSSR